MKISNVIISGTGCYIPKNVVTNQDFAKNNFFDENGQAFDASHDEIAEKFKAITGIEERRYVDDSLVASDIGAIASRLAIEDSGVDPETIDQIIVAHNFGDVKPNTIQTDILPSLASRIKQELGIKNLNLEHRHHLEYRAKVGGGLIEHEVVDVYVGYAPPNFQVELNPDEVMAIEWLSFTDIKSAIEQNPERFTPWLKIFCCRIKILWNF